MMVDALKTIPPLNVPKYVLFLLLVLTGSLWYMMLNGHEHVLSINKLISSAYKEETLKESYEKNAKYLLQTIPPRRTVPVNCSALIKGDNSTVTKVKLLMRNEHRLPVYFMNDTKHCEEFHRKRGYILRSMTSEEAEFPIAFSILVYTDVSQFERLLRAIYRLQNYYCVHVDAKARPEIREAVKGIARCFHNVFMTSRSLEVRWGTMSVLTPEIICMKELWKYRKWKYFINLTGQEFPLKTNYELVQILKAYNGANDVEGTIKRANSNRWKTAGPAPLGIIPLKGAVHVVVSRGYVDYLLHNETAATLLEWVKKTEIPDETYFATLNHNPRLRVPGSYNGSYESVEKKSYLARLKNWGDYPCAGKRVRSVCIFGIGDLPLLVKARQLFANKFHLNFQPYTLDCLEEWHYNRTRSEYLGQFRFNDSYYRTLDFVKNRI